MIQPREFRSKAFRIVLQHNVSFPLVTPLPSHVPNSKDKKTQMKEEIRKGTEVELSIDDCRGFHVVVGEAKFLVRFKSLKTYDGNMFLIEEFGLEHLMVDCYGLNDKIGRTTLASCS